jgi:RimJ/RimL family protein N-acetyltransferase
MLLRFGSFFESNLLAKPTYFPVRHSIIRAASPVIASDAGGASERLTRILIAGDSVKSLPPQPLNGQRHEAPQTTCSMSNAEQIILRAWRRSDISSLIRYANNRKIWLNLRDIFPHPYMQADAEKWIAICESSQEPTTNFAVELRGEAVGGIGCRLLDDVNCKTAEIGYWLGKPFWGRGIATAALTQTTDYAFRIFSVERLQATVFEWNPASARVLEKCGYVLEGRLRRSIFKDGRLGDSLLYAHCRE